ncbi:MAG: hypothetical protein K6F00_10770, partial [Lachnospiraceae bacterium]|nr:hypothetical protein [Lachnospiraceae bacterium]
QSKRNVNDSYIDRQIAKQDAFMNKLSGSDDYVVTETPLELNKNFNVENDAKNEIKKFDNVAQKRFKADAQKLNKEWMSRNSSSGMGKYGFRLTKKPKENTFPLMVGIHDFGMANMLKQLFAKPLAGDPFYQEHKEMIDALAPSLELKDNYKDLGRQNPFGDVEFTEQSVAECKAFYENLSKDMAKTLYDAVLYGMYKLDTMSVESFSKDAIPQKFMEMKFLRDRLGAIHEFTNMDSNTQGPIGDVIRRLKGVDSFEVDDEYKEKEDGKEVTKVRKRTVLVNRTVNEQLNYYIETCGNMHMAIDSDMRTALEKNGIDFKNSSGFLHSVDENGFLNQLGKKGGKLNTYFHTQRKGMDGEGAITYFEVHKKQNLTQANTRAVAEHNRYMSMLMDNAFYSSLEKPEGQTDEFGIAKSALKLHGSNKEIYEKNKEMLDEMFEDTKGISAAIDQVRQELAYFKKLKEEVNDPNQKDPAVLRIIHNEQMKKYLDIHIQQKQSGLLKLMSRADGYLNALSNVYRNTELTDLGTDIINQYNLKGNYQDNSKSATQIRKIAEYYSLSPVERNKAIIDKFQKIKGQEFTVEKQSVFTHWLYSADGEFVMNYLGATGFDVYDAKPEEVVKAIEPYTNVFGNEKPIEKETLMDKVAGMIVDINNEFQERFNNFFGKVDMMKFGTMKVDEIQGQIDAFINMHLKYDSLNRMLSTTYKDQTIGDAIKAQIKQNNGDDALEKYEKNRSIIWKQFTIVEDILFEYRLGEVIKKLNKGASIESLYNTERQDIYESDNDIVGVLSLYQSHAKQSKKLNRTALSTATKLYLTEIQVYYNAQCKRTQKSIDNLRDFYVGNAKTTLKGNQYNTNLNLFMERLKQYSRGQVPSDEQQEFGSESKGIEEAIKGIKFSKGSQDNNENNNEGNNENNNENNINQENV